MTGSEKTTYLDDMIFEIVGIQEITEKNWTELYFRLRMYAANGLFANGFVLTPELAYTQIGYKNAFITPKTAAQFKNQFWTGRQRDAASEASKWLTERDGNAAVTR
ncbi:hypothetical protein [Streptomyces aurantiacus]|uniref:hypothetical protein n=1 Tax=Streptomyces aurantiacus TaxID=47760 RepID=UPI0006E44152|nr:hypothetical protein [Streptomyces aurantiacus]